EASLLRFLSEHESAFPGSAEPTEHARIASGEKKTSAMLQHLPVIACTAAMPRTPQHGVTLFLRCPMNLRTCTRRRCFAQGLSDTEACAWLKCSPAKGWGYSVLALQRIWQRRCCRRGDARYMFQLAANHTES